MILTYSIDTEIILRDLKFYILHFPYIFKVFNL